MAIVVFGNQAYKLQPKKCDQILFPRKEYNLIFYLFHNPHRLLVYYFEENKISILISIIIQLKIDLEENRKKAEWRNQNKKNKIRNQEKKELHEHQRRPRMV